MDQMQLTREDVALLFDALEAWKARGFGGKMMSTVFRSLASKGDPEARAKLEAEMAEEDRTEKEKSRADSERAVMVQAKLVMLRDRLEIESALR